MRAHMIGGLVAAALTVAACGGDSTETARAAPSTSTKPTTTTSTKPTTTTRPTTTTTVPASVEASDAVRIRCDGDRMEIAIARPAERERFEDVWVSDIGGSASRVDLEVNAALDGYQCGHRHAYNDDFSMFAGHASAGDGTTHVFITELRTGRTEDLSASRQGSGFSAGTPINELFVSFLPAAPDQARFTDRILISNGDGFFVVDPANPDQIEPMPLTDGMVGDWPVDTFDHLGSGIDFHDNDGFGGGGYRALSPDGRLIAIDNTNVSRVYGDPYADETRLVDGACNGDLLGWHGTRTLVTMQRRPSQFYLVTVDDTGGTTGCTPVLPANDREIVSARLRVDGNAVWMRVEGADGIESYLVDLTTPGAEPVEQRPVLIFDEPNLHFYLPRDA